jgi:hypothetical protein
MIMQNGMVSKLVPARAAGNLYIGGVFLATSVDAAILEVRFP